MRSNDCLLSSRFTSSCWCPSGYSSRFVHSPSQWLFRRYCCRWGVNLMRSCSFHHQTFSSRFNAALSRPYPHNQVLIIITGNYNFFNYNTILLCIPLLDDAVLGRFFSVWKRDGRAHAPSNNESTVLRRSKRLWTWVTWLLFISVFVGTTVFSAYYLRFDWNQIAGDKWTALPDRGNKHPFVSLAFGDESGPPFWQKRCPTAFWLERCYWLALVCCILRRYSLAGTPTHGNSE